MVQASLAWSIKTPENSIASVDLAKNCNNNSRQEAPDRRRFLCNILLPLVAHNHLPLIWALGKFTKSISMYRNAFTHALPVYKIYKLLARRCLAPLNAPLTVHHLTLQHLSPSVSPSTTHLFSICTVLVHLLSFLCAHLYTSPC